MLTRVAYKVWSLVSGSPGWLLQGGLNTHTGKNRPETDLSFPASRHEAAVAAAAAKSLQSCPTPCDPIDGSPPGSPFLGFSRQKHWSGLPFPSPMHESEKWKWSRSVVSNSSQPHGAYQAPPSMGFSRQEYRGGVPLLSLGTKMKTCYINRLNYIQEGPPTSPPSFPRGMRPQTQLLDWAT